MRKRRKHKSTLLRPPQPPKPAPRAKCTIRFRNSADIMRMLQDISVHGKYPEAKIRKSYIVFYRRNYVKADWKSIVDGVQELNTKDAIDHYKVGRGGNILSVMLKER